MGAGVGVGVCAGVDAGVRAGAGVGALVLLRAGLLVQAVSNWCTGLSAIFGVLAHPPSHGGRGTQRWDDGGGAGVGAGVGAGAGAGVGVGVGAGVGANEGADVGEEAMVLLRTAQLVQAVGDKVVYRPIRDFRRAGPSAPARQKGNLEVEAAGAQRADDKPCCILSCGCCSRSCCAS